MWGMELHIDKGIVLVALVKEKKKEQWEKKESGRIDWSVPMFQDPA